MRRLCRVTGKVNYQSENAARRALERFQRDHSERVLSGGTWHGKPVQAYYRCPDCPYWHLTSNKRFGYRERAQA